MRRLFRLIYLTVLLCIISFMTVDAQLPQVFVSGRIAPNDVRVFLKDSVYIINRDYVVTGTLIIEPGTTVYFYPQGRIIDSCGGRIIADGFANATYTANPIGNNCLPVNPIAPNSGYNGYSDLNYFTFAGVCNDTNITTPRKTITVGTDRDLTVNQQKENFIFNVLLDKTNRRISNLRYEGGYYNPNPNFAKVVSFEEAIMFYAARMNENPDNDLNLKMRSWKRINNQTVDITEGQIKFIGQPFYTSREWGHIIVLPGARAAFFRNCQFDGFKKDTTVDRMPIYGAAPPGVNLATLNNTFRMLTNGSGGAMTTFSSRTWLLNCEFTNNTAKYRGGALQILQAPEIFPRINIESLGYYPSDKNPNINNKDGYTSDVISQYPIPRIDMIDEPGLYEPLSDENRQGYDDARLALYLGRIRNNKFVGNKVLLANIGQRQVGNITVLYDKLDEPANYPMEYGNITAGGAIYIAGCHTGERRQLEVGLGVNNSINIYNDEEDSHKTLVFSQEDSFEASGNSANNYQSNPSTWGARGGAIYLGRYTSLIVAGKFVSNETKAEFLQDEYTGANSGYYSMGGAIFTENTYGRLQVRSGPKRDLIDNATIFNRNYSGAGGAIFVDGNTDPRMSPIIGGSDQTLETRDYGFNLKFTENYAISWGGAILSKRNLTINGSGGVESNTMLGYGGKYPVLFEKNTAGYAGGALHISIPNAQPPLPPSQRTVQIVRAEFAENIVGEDIHDMNKAEIRGGGAIYSIGGDLNVVKGTEFRANKVINGNGGAIALIHPSTSSKRFFLSDLDNVYFNYASGVADGYWSSNDVFTYRTNKYPPDASMLTRFLDNKIEVEPEILESQSGSGMTQIGGGTQGTANRLLATTFLNDNVGFAVGYRGTIVKITQGGNVWQYKNYPTDYRLNDVYFTTWTTGYIVGDRGLILKTVNNGDSWREVRSPIETWSLNQSDLLVLTLVLQLAIEVES